LKPLFLCHQLFQTEDLIERWKTAVLAILLVSCLLACSSRAEGESKDAQAYVNQGIEYGKKGDLDRAIADYTRALQLDTQNWRAQYKKAGLLDKSGKPKEALEAYQSFLKSAPPQEKDSIEWARERIKALQN
jgi:tetratricopeptide (TPR) repeat protein